MKTVRYSHVFFTLVGILAVLVWFSYQNYTKLQSTIHIALAAPLTGNSAHKGKSYRQGIQLYFDHVNATGGIKGKRLVLDEYDDQNECKQLAAQQARHIVEDNRAIAVIGHNYSDCSVSASKIYQHAQIPAISPSSTDVNLTIDNPWYFRTIFNNKTQGHFLAYYAKKVLAQTTVSIIYKDVNYGNYLTKAFEQAAHEVGIEIKYKWEFQSDAPDLDTRLAQIVDELALKPDAGLLLLATHAPEGSKLIRLIKDHGLNFKIIGPDSFGINSLQDYFNELPREKIVPGFYTDNFYTTIPLIFDSANEAAQLFRDEYRKKYQEEPDWHAAFAYDAAMVLGEAIKNSEAIGDSSTVEADRHKIKDYLSQEMTYPNNAVHGVTGVNLFDAYGDPLFKAISVGIFKGGKIISAPVQLQNIKHVEIASDFDDTVHKNNIIILDGAMMNKVNVVYTGVDINEISEIDLDTLTYKIDFLLWFRYLGDFSPQNLEFTNAAEPIELEKPVESDVDEDGVYQLYHVKGRFKTELTSDYYLFDQHILPIRLRHKELTRDQLIYVADILGMQDEENLTKALRQAQVLSSASGWSLKDIRFSQNTVLEGSLGKPNYLNAGGDVEFSLFSTHIVVQKNKFSLHTLLNQGIAEKVFVASVIVLLLLNLIDRSTHFSFPKLILLLQAIVAATFLLSSEMVTIAHFIDNTDVYSLQIVTIIFNVLWWIVSALLLHLAAERFIWLPLEKNTERKIPNIIRGFFAFLIYTLAFFGIIAFVFGQPLTSLLATSGVIAMIIGLAIQINISNIFSGIALNVERPFRVGDWVKIGDNDDAKVINITWRTTRVQLRNNAVLSIPNSMAAESKIVNYTYPESLYKVIVNINIDPRHSPDLVEKILVDAVLSCQYILKEPKPIILFNGVNEWSANYKLIASSNDYAKLPAAAQELWKRAWAHLNRAGIDFAIKQQKIHVFDGVAERGEEATKPITLLHEIEIFLPFSEEDKQKLSEQMELQRFAANDVIVKQGQCGDSLFIIVEGVVSVQVNTSNEQESTIEVARLGAGNFFGEMALLTGEERTATIIAMTDTRVYEITKAILMPLLQNQPQASHLISKILTNRQMMTQSQINDQQPSDKDKQSIYEQFLHRIENFFGLKTKKTNS